MSPNADALNGIHWKLHRSPPSPSHDRDAKIPASCILWKKREFFLATGFCHINCYAQSEACFFCSLPLYVTIEKPREPVTFWVAPYKGIQDSLGSWIPRRGFRIPGTGFRTFETWNVDSGIQWVVGFRIPWVVFRTPKPRISDPTSKNFSTSGVRIPL